MENAMPNRRSVLLGAGALGLTAAWGEAAFAAAPFDAAVVGAGNKPAGVPLFDSLTAAVAAAPLAGRKPFRILVGTGVWRERLVIDKPFIHLVGEGRDASVVVCNRVASDLGADGNAIGTFKTPTVYVRAPDFRAAHLTIANDFDYLGHVPAPVPTDKSGASGSQAVALSIEGAADRALFEDVRLTGYQDTLYTDAGRSLFRACRIEGCVDFIFGAGRAVFEACEIVSKPRGNQSFGGYIAAPDTDVHQPFGLVFSRCRLIKGEGLAPHSTALGRPWRHTKTFPDGRYGDPDNVGAAAYLDCWMDDHILPEGWQPMGYNKKEGGKAELTPEDARFFEYRSSGPGAGQASARRRFLSDAEALAFDKAKVLQGWLG
jgi:pectinesterase